jgi:small subunit ribosomal protein S5
MAEEEKKENEEVKQVVEAKEVEEIKKVPTEEEKAVEEIGGIRVESVLDKWKPKTSLGRKVFNGEINDIEEILKLGRKISEAEIVDKLVPNLKNELVLIGGRAGKGGGAERIPVKITAAMHKSGRRFKMSAFVVVGNEDGLVGVGRGSALEARDAIAKGIQRAKTNLIKVRRGCGSWECGCGNPHSVQFKTYGRSGSVKVYLLPAPKGVGLVADPESRKILKLAGIKDVWLKTFGNTSMRMNLITAIYNALKNLYVYEKAGV